MAWSRQAWPVALAVLVAFAWGVRAQGNETDEVGGYDDGSQTGPATDDNTTSGGPTSSQETRESEPCADCVTPEPEPTDCEDCATETFDEVEVQVDEEVAAGENESFAFGDDLTLTFFASEDGAEVNMTVDLAQDVEDLGSPVEPCDGALVYLQVHANSTGIARLRVAVDVDPSAQHSFSYWNGARWTAMPPGGGTILGEKGGRDLNVYWVKQTGGRLEAEIDHSSSFAITNELDVQARSHPEVGHGAAGLGAVVPLAGCLLALLVRRPRPGNR